MAGVSAAWDAELGQKAKSAARGTLRWGRWPAAGSRGGGSERVAFVWRSRGWSVGGERASAVGGSGDGRPGKRRWGRLGPSTGGGCCCSLRRSAPGVRPRGASVHGSSRRGSPRREKAGGAGAAPQPTCPLARLGAREWSPRHDEPPGGNDEGPPATQNISPQPSGAGRALHEPPARSPPRGPAPKPDSRRAGRERVRVPARARGRSSARQAARCGQLPALPFPPPGPPSARPAPGGRVRWRLRCWRPRRLETEVGLSLGVV